MSADPRYRGRGARRQRYPSGSSPVAEDEQPSPEASEDDLACSLISDLVEDAVEDLTIVDLDDGFEVLFEDADPVLPPMEPIIEEEAGSDEELPAESVPASSSFATSKKDGEGIEATEGGSEDTLSLSDDEDIEETVARAGLSPGFGRGVPAEDDSHDLVEESSAEEWVFDYVSTLLDGGITTRSDEPQMPPRALGGSSTVAATAGGDQCSEAPAPAAAAPSASSHGHAAETQQPRQGAPVAPQGPPGRTPRRRCRAAVPASESTSDREPDLAFVDCPSPFASPSRTKADLCPRPPSRSCAAAAAAPAAATESIAEQAPTVPELPSAEAPRTPEPSRAKQADPAAPAPAPAAPRLMHRSKRTIIGAATRALVVEEAEPPAVRSKSSRAGHRKHHATAERARKLRFEQFSAPAFQVDFDGGRGFGSSAKAFPGMAWLSQPAASSEGGAVSAMAMDLGEGSRSTSALDGARMPEERAASTASEPLRVTKASSSAQSPVLLPALPGTSSGSVAWSLRMARANARRSAMAAVF